MLTKIFSFIYLRILQGWTQQLNKLEMREIVYSKVYFPAVSCFPAIFLHCSRITYDTIQSRKPLFYFRTKFLYLKNSC